MSPDAIHKYLDGIFLSHAAILLHNRRVDPEEASRDMDRARTMAKSLSLRFGTKLVDESFARFKKEIAHE